MAAPRPAQPIPTNPLPSRGFIEFRHPGYEGVDNLLIKLPRVDAAGSQYGVHHGTALLACQIIAGNAFEGYLVDDQRERITVGKEAVLIDPIYYFVIDGQDDYAVVPSFQDWEYPHSYHLNWPVPPVSIPAGRGCCITRYSYATEQAHLVPSSEMAWFLRNSMRQYGDLENLIDTAANLVPMRSDLHCIFDSRWFVIVPKPDYRVHIISNNAGEVVDMIHNLPIQAFDSDPRPFLLARFAWAILFAVKGFVICNQPRKVIVREITENKTTYVTKVMSGADLRCQYGGGGSKGATPLGSSKRTRGLMEEEESNNSSPREEDFLFEPEGVMEEWTRRSRRLQQATSETTAPQLAAVEELAGDLQPKTTSEATEMAETAETRHTT